MHATLGIARRESECGRASGDLGGWSSSSLEMKAFDTEANLLTGWINTRQLPEITTGQDDLVFGARAARNQAAYLDHKLI